MKKALILTDGKAGHENQSKALASALGLEFEVEEVHFPSKLAKAMTYMGIPCRGPINHLANRDVACVIGAGSGTFQFVRELAKMTGTKGAAILYPRGYRIGSFDCILAPSFDRPKKADNVIELPVNMTANGAEFYEAGVAKFKDHYQKTTGREVKDGEKAVSVIVGGPNKCSTMTAEWMREQLTRIFDSNKDCEKWITTSRRTPKDVEEVIDSFPFDYKLVYSRDQFNPIPAFMMLSRTLYVTAESTGMLSEACTYGDARVEVLDNLNPGGHKFRRFVEDLIREGYANGNRKVQFGPQIARAKELLGI